MLYNYINNKEYKFDLNALFSQLDRVADNLYNQRSIQNAHEIVDLWKKVLSKLYHQKKKIKYIFTELFQKEIRFGHDHLYLHFDVEALKNTAKNIKPQMWSVQDFAKVIYQNYSEEKAFRQFTSQDIMIIVPFIGSNTIGLVADGNHRLSAHMNSKSNSQIPVVLVSLPQMNNCFFNNFEKAFYVLQYEIWELSQIGMPMLPLSRSKVQLFL